MVGRIVCSKAGRDKGKYMVITEVGDTVAYVCDGKERPLERPKVKNLKHLSFTGTYLDREQFASNRALKKAIAVFVSRPVDK